ncbi:hypothetical protein FOA52_000281 [Chlamydomonas sp. UWO 241]|nr:hypothetical protein FOA52_000281 [Chlamydomonas sp. UWO 241]
MLSASTCSTPCNLDLVDKSSMAILQSHLIAVPDAKAPIVACPADIPALPTDLGVCGATTITGTATASDNCGTASIAPAPGATLTLPVGINTVGYTASDGATPANTATCTQTVTVVDNELPTITCPTDPVVVVLSSAETRRRLSSVVPENCALMPDLVALSSFSDNGAVVSTSMSVGGVTIAAGACLPTATCDETLTATITVMDAAGNSASCMVDMYIQYDIVAPSVSCVDTTLYADASCQSEMPEFTTSTSDDCIITSNVQTPAAGSMLMLGATEVSVTASDQANTATCTSTVIVVDTTPPTITCPADATALPNDLGVCAATTSTGTAIASDNCGTIASISPAPGATLTLPVGINTMGYTASDGATPANTATCTQTVTVVDIEAPVIACPADATAVPNDLGICGATTTTGTSIASDNCVTTSISPAPGATLTLSVGTRTVDYTVSDGAMPVNTATCTQTVTVKDTEAPIVNCPATYVVLSGSNCTARMPDLAAEATYSDNCIGIASVGVTVGGETYAPGACLPTEVCNSNLSATITKTDGSGNAAACTTTLLIDGDGDKYKADAKCNNCVKQASPPYKNYGLTKVCSSCSCPNIDEAVRSKCYNCLSWTRPENFDGSWCTGCAALAKFPELGGVPSVDKCMSCVVNLDSFCIKKDSCASPPKTRSDGITPFLPTPAEINACWNCMSQHKFYKWGSVTMTGQGQCGNVASKTSTGTNPMLL